MGDLALIGLHDRLHAFRPAPTRLDVESPDRKPLELEWPAPSDPPRV